MTFEEAVDKANNLDTKPPTNVLLQLYGLYKQATEGNVQSSRPSGFDFKAMAKYDAWAGHQGKSADEAKKEYVDIVTSLLKD